jgi:hypothetical protein
MTEIKSCITCKHCENPEGSFYVWCNKFTYDTTDYVKGEVSTWRENCVELRKPDGKCGPDGLEWEQRPPEEEKPKSKLRKFLDAVVYVSRGKD